MAPTGPTWRRARRRQARCAPATPVAFGQTMTAAARDALAEVRLGHGVIAAGVNLLAA